MILIWLAFALLVVGMLLLDLGVFHRTHRAQSTADALAWTALWIGLALAFAVFIYFAYENHWAGLGTHPDAITAATTNGRAAVIKYLSGYILEKSLSVDNIFVISMIFGAFAVPAEYQHRVLFWGVISAILMRAVMIFVGTELIARHHWLVYLFGMVLIATAIKMLLMKSHGSPSDNIAVRWAKKILPVTDQYHGPQFIVPLDAPPTTAPLIRASFALTPLALALIAIEATDLLFAIDSVPAIFAVTTDPFLVLTSNIFAMLGLRSLYFALSGMMERFRYLKASLAFVLAVVGFKMLAAGWLKSVFGAGIELWLLGVILLILVAGVLASLRADRAR